MSTVILSLKWLGGALFMWLMFATVYPVILIMKLPKERRTAGEINLMNQNKVSVLFKEEE